MLHPCQTDCVRKEIDHPVQIQSLEKYVADTANDPIMESNGDGENERVIVLGAGPVGLTAAYFLGRAGISVSVFDPLDQPGGFLADLDKKRLPAEVLSREISRLAQIAGLDLKMNADPEGLSKTASDDDWNLVLYDKTSHPANNPAAEQLAELADMFAVSHRILSTEKITSENGFKASQVARAVAAGRELAGEALKILGKETQAPAGANNSTSEPVPREELRLDVLASQAGSADGLKKDDFSTTRALEEAERCFSCGQCNQCGQCLLFCPDVSIQMDENQKHPVVDLEHCKGCGICAATCPRRVIVMERVS